jgi:hypothetical protein
MNEHCLPYARQSESARHISVLNNHGGAHEFLRACGGSARQDIAAHMRFLHSFQAPSNTLAEIPPDRWTTAETARLTDGQLETAWTFVQTSNATHTLEMPFNPPVALASVRLLARKADAYPIRWHMDVQTEPGGTWTNVFPDTPITSYYWSGPRPYSYGRAYRLQARFEPRMASGLRIVFPPDSVSRTCVVSEVTCFGPGAPTPDEESAAAQLASVLRETGVRRLYSDRWIAQAVRTATAGAVATEVQPLWLDPGWRDTCSHLTLAAGVALLARSEDAPACRRVLARHGVTMDETPVPPWTLMQFRAAAAGPVTNLVWLGPVCAER